MKVYELVNLIKIIILKLGSDHLVQSEIRYMSGSFNFMD